MRNKWKKKLLLSLVFKGIIAVNELVGLVILNSTLLIEKNAGINYFEWLYP